MTSKEIQIITGLSPSYINKVRTGKIDGLNQLTVNHVTFLLELEVNYLDALFCRTEFSKVCTTVLEKATRRDHKNIVNIVRLANKCLRRHRTLLKEKNNEIGDDNAQELMGIYLADSKKLIQDELFCQMCSIAISISKNIKLRTFCDFLLDISELLKTLNKK